MLSFTHTLAALPFGVYLENPIIIFASTFVFHLFADSLPHWNIYPDQMKRYPYGLVALDIVGGVVAAWLVLGSTFFTVPVLVAIAGSNAPDVLHGLWDILSPRKQRQAPNWVQAAFRFHDRLQLETQAVAPGLVFQLLVIVVAIGLL